MHCMKGEGGVFYYRPNILLAVVCLFLRANKFRYSFIRTSSHFCIYRTEPEQECYTLGGG